MFCPISETLTHDLQCVSTGLDEDYKKPKHLAVQLVRLLDDESTSDSDRLRLIILYLMYRNGLLGGDIKKLLAHSNLPPQNGEVIQNLDLLGVRVEKQLKDSKSTDPPIFPRKPPASGQQNEDSLLRFEPNLKLMLEEQLRGTLDPTIFPFTRPQADQDGGMTQDQLAQSSLRSAKPTWARTRSTTDLPRQRLIVFMAGGATFSESRTCYEISQSYSKDVYLATTHMCTPAQFLRQIGDLSVDKRRLDIPAERPKPVAPAYLFEKDEPRPPPVQQQQKSTGPSPTPPTASMASMSLKGPPPASNGSPAPSGKIKKDKEKKKLGFFR